MMTKDSNSISGTPAPLSNDGRGRSYRPELGSAFEERLGAAQQRYSRDDNPRTSKDDDTSSKRSDEKGENKESRSSQNSEENKGAGKPRRFGDQDQQEQDGRSPFEGLTQMAPPPLQALDAIMPIASISGMDPALVAQLERIAAAIAEGLPRDVYKQMSIAFGKADTLAQGAILTRDASGAISIHIAGLHPGVTAAQSVRLQQELRTRLMARKLEVRDIAFTGGLVQNAQSNTNSPQPNMVSRQS